MPLIVVALDRLWLIHTEKRKTVLSASPSSRRRCSTTRPGCGSTRNIRLGCRQCQSPPISWDCRWRHSVLSRPTQGIGQALLEHTVYDGESGQLLSGSFTDYAVPRADDLPPLDITLAELPTAVNQLGVKGAGQAGCMAAPQTIINAILDALAPLGVVQIDMPATPERVWRAIRTA